jgi:hypothetical protein
MPVAVPLSPTRVQIPVLCFLSAFLILYHEKVFNNLTELEQGVYEINNIYLNF